MYFFFFFFFQAEDGIRDLIVTGVQTCALPISFSGMSKLARLKRLNTSIRNCSCTPRLIGVVFTKPRSTVEYDGPSRLFLFALPRVPGVGKAKHCGLNHRFELLPPGTIFGLQPGTRSGRPGF